MRAGWPAAAGGALGVWLVLRALPAAGTDVGLLLGSGLGAALGALWATWGARAPMSRMENSMDAMYLGALGAGLAAAVLTSSLGATHVHEGGPGPAMAVMDGLMGGMLGGGMGGWWSHLPGVPRLTWWVSMGRLRR